MLVLTDYKEFRKKIYKDYVKIFPKTERKNLSKLEDMNKRNILKIYKVIEKDVYVGFVMIVNVNNKISLLEYFAILPKYRNKGYGTKTIKLLKTLLKSDLIFVEIEKLGLGENKKENDIRIKRNNFYNKLKFINISGFDLSICDVIFSPYIYYLNENKYTTKKIIKELFKIYIETYDEEIVEKYYKVIFNSRYFVEH